MRHDPDGTRLGPTVGDPMESCQIRLLDTGDLALMRGLLDCFGEAFDDPQTYCAAQPDDAYLSGLLGSESFFAIAAVIQGDVVGGLAGYELRKFEQPRSELYIYDLAVRAGYRRKGIATDLIERVRRLAREKGAWVVYVQADLGDDAAIALYDRVGSREDVLHFDIPPSDGESV